MSGSTNQKRAAPWAIRNVSLEARNAAIAASRREGLTLGEWLDRAVRQQVKAERKQAQAVGPTAEETWAKLAEIMAQQVKATQQQNATIMARMEALERGKAQEAPEMRGNLFVRLYGLLWRPVAQSDAGTGYGR
jgi:DNA topoisomerase VI subunit B